MVVKPDGTKWACQSCLKGHRVSGCTHTDRELTLVPKKGRPVTQCHHCRLERKKRSAHVKCDCGEVEKPHHSKEKCIHLREAEERAKAGYHDDQQFKEEDPHHLAAVAEEQGCCCGHGGKCSCSLVKRESQCKDGNTPHGPAIQKPRLETTKSDGQITVFTNGHHKPVHKRNHAAHESGMPYKMPMSRSNTDQHVATAARRSVDSLALDRNMSWGPSSTSTVMDPAINTERRKSKSEQPSPRQSAVDMLCDAKLSSIDFTTLGPVRTNQSVGSAMSDVSMFPPLDPMSALTDPDYDPWSAYPSTDSMMPDNNPFGPWATAFDNGNGVQPALTAASSGTQSEIDELPAMDDFGGFMPSIQEDGAPFGQDFVTAGANNSNRRSLPPGFFGNADFSAMANQWPAPVDNINHPDPGKSKIASNDQGTTTGNAWNTPTMPAMTSLAQGQRSTPNNLNLGRPQSHSIGPGSAPNDDLIKQLFPDIDVNTTFYGLTNSPTMFDSSSRNRFGGLPITSTSTAMDIGPMDETIGLTSQGWSDGSMSVPADTFTSPYNIQGDFSSTDFNGTWPYQ